MMPQQVSCIKCLKTNIYNCPECGTSQPRQSLPKVGLVVPIDKRTGRPEVSNQMKADLIGEFTVSVEMGCNCDLDEKCPACNGTGIYVYHAVIPWSTQKEIYKRMAEAASKNI